MKISILLYILLFAGFTLCGQDRQQPKLVSAVITDLNFPDTLTFHRAWNYPWYVIKHDDGHFEKTIGDTLCKEDTVRQYNTANCMTDHAGEHQVNYCIARVKHDTIVLCFQPELPGYANWMTVYIKKDSFWCDYSIAYKRPLRGKKLEWITNTQKLVLDTASYASGDTIKGHVDVEFTETIISPGGESSLERYYFKGFFRTALIRKE